MSVSSAPGSCGRGNRPACVPKASVVCMDFFFMRPSVSMLPFSPKAVILKAVFLWLPHSCGVFRHWCALCVASPVGHISFGRSFCFQGAVPNVRKSSLSEKNAKPGLLRELHFLKVCTFELAFPQLFCIMEAYGGGVYLWLYPELPDRGFQTFATGSISHKRNWRRK